MAIWDPAALADPDGTLALEQLTDDFAWVGLQIRNKQSAASQHVCHAVADAARSIGLSLWINRDVALAAAVHADGVVIGTTDRVPDNLPALVSIHAVSDIRPDVAVAGYLFGNIRETNSKPGKPGTGWDVFRDVCAATDLPVLGLGGVGLADEARAVAMGGWGVAGIRGAFGSETARLKSQPL